MLGCNHFPEELVSAAGHGQIHDDAEEEGHARFQYACPDLVAPGGREMAHPIDEGLPCPEQVKQENCRHNADHGNHNAVYDLSRPSREHRTDRAGKET